MAGAVYSLPLADGLYRAYLLEYAFELGKTDRPGSPYSVISHAHIEIQGKLRKVVFKTYHKINEATAEKAAQRTYREVMAWVSLASSPGRCDNINQFHGVWFMDPKLIPEATPGIPSIVTDHVKYGSLEYTEGRDFGLRLNIVRQLANGLCFMHSLDIIHGDIKPDNFRVTEGGIVKIIDLGLSRDQTVEHTGFTTTILPSYLSLAPELIIPDEDDVSMFVTKPSDVYASSMTALQVLDGQGHKSRPFNHCWGPYPVRKAIITHQWPQAQRYPGVTPQVWKIISACWTSDPSMRPSIDALLQSLSGISLL